jgi:hypothetical protein
MSTGILWMDSYIILCMWTKLLYSYLHSCHCVTYRPSASCIAWYHHQYQNVITFLSPLISKYFMVLGFDIKSPVLVRLVLHPLSLFYFGYYWDRVSYWCWSRPWPSYLHFPNIWNDSGATPCPAFYWLRWGLRYFLLGWLWTLILLISVYQVVGNTGVSHCARLISKNFLSIPK